MPFVEVSLPIQSEPKRLYEFIKKMEDYPSFMPDLLSVEVLERYENSTLTKWCSKVDGISIEWIELDTFDDENLQITYRQIEGDLNKFEGAWNLFPQENGAMVTLTVDFELGIPMLSGLIHPILKKKIRENCIGMLTAIQKRTV